MTVYQNYIHGLKTGDKLTLHRELLIAFSIPLTNEEYNYLITTSIRHEKKRNTK